jgi:hypothetical protein
VLADRRVRARESAPPPFVAARESDAITEYDGRVSVVRDEIDPRLTGREYSASQIERMARCPFGWFLERVLKIEPIEELERVQDRWLDARQFGTLVHEVLQTTMELVCESGEKVSLDRHLARVHEIAHQWFGDSVTEATWSDLWLSEGFAEYFAGLFVQRHEGDAAFQRYMGDEAQAYLEYEKNRRTPIHDPNTEDLFKLLNANNYQKGAWVLHMLRSELGDEQFFRGIRSYYDVHQNATATSEDLRVALEQASGRDLKDFFTRWIYGSGHPRYALTWGWNPRTNRLRIVLRQLQREPGFPNALPLELITAKGKRRITLKPKGKQSVEEIRLDIAPSAINLDPDNTVLKEAEVSQIH